MLYYTVPIFGILVSIYFSVWLIVWQMDSCTETTCSLVPGWTFSPPSFRLSYPKPRGVLTPYPDWGDKIIREIRSQRRDVLPFLLSLIKYLNLLDYELLSYRITWLYSWFNLLLLILVSFFRCYWWQQRLREMRFGTRVFDLQSD